MPKKIDNTQLDVIIYAPNSYILLKVSLYLWSFYSMHVSAEHIPTKQWLEGTNGLNLDGFYAKAYYVVSETQE